MRSTATPEFPCLSWPWAHGNPVRLQERHATLSVRPGRRGHCRNEPYVGTQVASERRARCNGLHPGFVQAAAGIEQDCYEARGRIVMAETRQVLFIQGGGAGAHDEWDDKLVDSLRRELGAGYDVRYPRMPDEDSPSYAGWSAAIRRELTALDDGTVVVGHSVGGTILINVLAERPPERELGVMVLIAAPFVGAGGWPGD